MENRMEAITQRPLQNAQENHERHFDHIDLRVPRLGHVLNQSSSMMNQIFTFMVLGAGLLYGQSVPQETRDATFDPQRIRTGTFSYRDLDHGKEVGKASITIRKLPGSENYVFSAKATFATDFEGFPSQQWEATATPTLGPVSAKLAFVRDSEVSPIFDLQYSEGSVTGFFIRHKEKKAVSATVPANTVDQRIDWAAVLASNLETGRRFEFNVYDPGTGISKISGQVGQVEETHLPAGTFRAYRIIYQIDKAGKTEHYQMLASQDLPRTMLLEEFPNGVVSELTQINRR
jgi:hypothetical protein